MPFLERRREPRGRRADRWALRAAVLAFALALAGPAAAVDTVDTDADGVPDTDDNCPAAYNPAQENADGDLFGDVCDVCREVPDDLQRDTDGDGCGNRCDTDFDQNGLADMADFTVMVENFGEEEPDARPETELTGDGVVDLDDWEIFSERFGTPPGPGLPDASCSDELPGV